MKPDAPRLRPGPSPPGMCNVRIRSGQCRVSQIFVNDLLGGTALAFQPIVTDVSARGPSVCLSVSMSVTLVRPAKAVGQNEMLFGRDTRLVPSNTVLDMPPTGREDLGGRKSQSPRSVRRRKQ